MRTPQPFFDHEGTFDEEEGNSEDDGDNAIAFQQLLDDVLHSEAVFSDAVDETNNTDDIGGPELDDNTSPTVRTL